MNLARVSKLEAVWATRQGGASTTDRRYRDILIDGAPLSSLFKLDVISPFGWVAADEAESAVDRLLGRGIADLPGGRVSLYVCPECGDLGCGAISLAVDVSDALVTWREFAYQNNYDGEVHRKGFEDIGPFTFHRQEYDAVMVVLRQRAGKDGA